MSISHWFPGPGVLLMDCGWEGLELSIGLFRISRGIAGSIFCWVPVPARLFMDWGCVQLEPRYRALSESIVWLSLVFLYLEFPELWLRGSGAGSWATSGSTARSEVCMPLNWCMVECDSSQVPWHMVLVTDPKSNRAVAEFSRIWTCFRVCKQDHSQRASHLGASLLSQNGCPRSWTALRFHNPYLGPKAVNKALLSWMDARLLLRREKWAKDILFDHFAHITPYVYNFKSFMLLLLEFNKEEQKYNWRNWFTSDKYFFITREINT